MNWGVKIHMARIGLRISNEPLINLINQSSFRAERAATARMRRARIKELRRFVSGSRNPVQIAMNNLNRIGSTK